MQDSQAAQIQGDQGEPQSLKALYFYLTEGCNLACSHCWLSPSYDPEGKKYPFLPLDLFQQIISEARPLGLERIKLTGGEPLLHPDILTLLEIVQQENLELNMETNGILCTEEIAAAIARQHKPFVSISLDAVEADIHDRIRGKKGAFAQTIQAVKTLTAQNVPTQIIMTLMQDNVDQLERMISLAETLGAGSLKFNIVQPVGRGKSIHGSRAVSVPELISLGRKVETECAANTHVSLYFSIPPAFKPLRKVAPDTDGCGTCGIYSILGVLPGGEYALCGIGSQVKELVFGHAPVDALAAVWQTNPILQEIHQGLPQKMTGICSRCLMKHFCLGSCIAHNYYSSGSIRAPFWFCRQAEETGFFPPSRLG